MKNNVYVIYNKLSCRYGDVQAYPTDSFAVTRIREIFASQHFDISEVELCRVGTIDIETGVVDGSNPVRVDMTQGLVSNENS